ncbi:MAG: hypothetical protein NTW12_05325 [Deltaproteobacteria bacterium]|nr:hypothetical protein [Deltaproteobacteria bacterium]
MRSKIIVAVGIIAGMVLLYSGVGFCQEKVSGSEWTQIIEKMGDKGKINWSEGYIEALGIGAPPERYIGKPNARPMALRAGKIDAYRNLLEITKGVRVDSTTVVKDFTVESDVINAQVEGLVKGAQVINQEYMSDGTVEVTVRMPLSGNFSQVIIPKALDRRREMAPPVIPPAAPAAPVPAAGVVYTGMVIDARGLQARPAMSPKVLDENGKEVYGSMNVDREYAVQQGMSGYARDLTAAQSNPRVTNNPVSVKGIKTEGPGKSDIVISNADAEKIRGTSENLIFLKKCRVMVVLD